MRGRPEHYREPAVVANYRDRYAAGFARWKHRRKARLIDRWLGENETVLEVACGPGRFFATISGRNPVQLDRSLEMLRDLRARGPHARVVASDASALPFADRQFDVVLCIRFVAHLRGEFRSRVLGELARVARQRVLIDGRHRYNLRFCSRWLRRRLRLAHADKLRHSYREYHEELAAAGLEILAMRSIAWGLSARMLILAKKVPPANPRAQAALSGGSQASPDRR